MKSPLTRDQLDCEFQNDDLVPNLYHTSYEEYQKLMIKM